MLQILQPRQAGAHPPFQLLWELRQEDHKLKVNQSKFFIFFKKKKMGL